MGKTIIPISSSLIEPKYSSFTKEVVLMENTAN